METIAKVDYWNRAPLQIDHAEDNFRRLRQSRHLDGTNDPLDRRQTQSDPQFIKTKDNQLCHRRRPGNNDSRSGGSSTTKSFFAMKPSAPAALAAER